MDYLGSHLDDSLSLKELADLACCTPSHFIRLYAQKVRETPIATVRRLRLKRALEAVRAGNRRLIDIAQDAGYCSHEAFTRAFTRQFGHAPSHLPPVPRLVSQPLSWRLARMSATPVIQAAFTGTKQERNNSICKLVGYTAASGVKRWRLWHWFDDDDVIEPHGSKLSRSCCMIPLAYLPATIKGIDTALLPEGFFAVVSHFGAAPYPSIPALAQCIESQSPYRLCEGFRHLREISVAGYTAPQERHIELWLPIAGRTVAAERALRQLRSSPLPALRTS